MVLAHAAQVVTADHPWRVDLSSLAATIAGLGTALLALFTWRLAAETRSLARETGEDVRAEWRPVITSDHDATAVFRDDWGVKLVSFFVSIENHGRGPALRVSATARIDGEDDPPVQSVDRYAVIDRGDPKSFDFPAPPFPRPRENETLHIVVDVIYEDLAERQFVTRLSYEFRPREWPGHIDEDEPNAVDVELVDVCIGSKPRDSTQLLVRDSRPAR